MKVLFPYIDNPSTGKAFFLSRLIPELEKIGVTCITDDSKKCDITFHLVKYDKNKFKNCKNIVRLDGVNVDKNKKSDNRQISKSYSDTDGIIFQSNFSKKCCREFLEKKMNLKCKFIYDIIPNGADPTFYDNLPIIPKKFKHTILCSSRWRRHKRLKEMTDIFLELSDKDIGLIVTGEPDYVVKNKNIDYVGRLNAKDLGSYYKSCDCFFFLSWIDNCPNNVVESLCAGTPCVVGDQGGTKELIKEECGKICDISDPFPFDYINVKNPPIISEKSRGVIINNIKYLLNNKITVKNQHVNIKNISIKYKNFFERVMST